MFELFRTRRFLPLFITQFFGAFNDNYLKCAILTLVTFKLAADASRAAMLTNLAMAVFILPYFLFSALAGQISDKFDKAPCCRIVKFAEIVLMALAAAAFLCGNIPALLMLLFLMGAQSTFFSPAKYSLLPQHLKERELVAGNALIEGGTFLAILIGSIAGSLIIALPGGEGWSGLLLTGLAIIGYMASCRIPPAPPIEPGVRLSLHLAGETKKNSAGCISTHPGTSLYSGVVRVLDGGVSLCITTAGTESRRAGRQSLCQYLFSDPLLHRRRTGICRRVQTVAWENLRTTGPCSSAGHGVVHAGSVFRHLWQRRCGR